MKSQALVTVVVTPRERFSFAKESLESLRANAGMPFELLYIDGSATASEWLETAARDDGFRVLRMRSPSPNAARNFALRHVKTPWVAWCENDILFRPGWLRHLVETGERHAAGVVAPLYLEAPVDDPIVHHAGGKLEIQGDGPVRQMRDEQHAHGRRLSEVDLPGEPFDTDFIEMHCVVTSRAALNAIGPFDERILATRDHLDFSLAARKAGVRMMQDLRAAVVFVRPERVERGDLPYYRIRWSDAWTRLTVARFREKWAVDAPLAARLRNARAHRAILFDPAVGRVRRWAGRWPARLLKVVLAGFETIDNNLRYGVRRPRGEARAQGGTGPEPERPA